MIGDDDDDDDDDGYSANFSDYSSSMVPPQKQLENVSEASDHQRMMHTAACSGNPFCSRRVGFSGIHLSTENFLERTEFHGEKSARRAQWNFQHVHVLWSHAWQGRVWRLLTS